MVFSQVAYFGVVPMTARARPSKNGGMAAAPPLVIGPRGRGWPGHHPGAYPAPGPLVGLAGRHRCRAEQFRRLCHLGRLRSRRLLLAAVHIAVLLAVLGDDVPARSGRTGHRRPRPEPGGLRPVVGRLPGRDHPGGAARVPFTCYYYRKAYYRAFWLSPPSCAVAEPHKRYTGETRFPLVLQNVHRYFFYLGVVLNAVLTYDTVVAFPTTTVSGATWVLGR